MRSSSRNPTHEVHLYKQYSPYPMGGGPVWQTGGYGFVLTIGAKVGRTPIPRGLLESTRLQVRALSLLCYIKVRPR